MKYKENKVDRKRFITKHNNNCPVCGRKEPRIYLGMNNSENVVSTTYECKTCGYVYVLRDGVRDESYTNQDFENWCDYRCSNCRYYDCVRNELECMEFVEFLADNSITDEEYNKQVDSGNIEPFIRGRKNV